MGARIDGMGENVKTQYTLNIGVINLEEVPPYWKVTLHPRPHSHIIRTKIERLVCYATHAFHQFWRARTRGAEETTFYDNNLSVYGLYCHFDYC